MKKFDVKKAGKKKLREEVERLQAWYEKHHKYMAILEERIEELEKEKRIEKLELEKDKLLRKQ
jgi:hypothetical protein